MNDNHAALITELYHAFADYRAAYPLTLCQCASCMPPDEQRAFLAISLRELPAPLFTGHCKKRCCKGWKTRQKR